MKYLISLLFTVVSFSFVVAQDLQYTDIIGTYEGYSTLDKKTKYKLVIKSNYTVSLSSKEGDIWLEFLDFKVEKKEFIYSTKIDGNYYELKILDDDSFHTLSLMIISDDRKKILQLNGVLLTMAGKESVISLDMNREDGNPVIQKKENPKNLFKEGHTAAWGKYQAEFNPTYGQGAFFYNYLSNMFLYTKNENEYIISDKKKEVKERIHIKYKYDTNTKKLKLAETPTLNAHLYNKKAIANQKEVGKYATDEKAILAALVDLTYALFDDVYKPLNNSFNKTENTTTGKFIVIYGNGSVYIGDFKDGNRDGKGMLISKEEKQKGTWKGNKRHGKFNVEAKEVDIAAYFENDNKEGTWIYTYKDGKKIEVVFKNDKKINAKEVTSNKTATNNMTYVKPKIEYKPIEKPVFTGKYQGDDLLDLLERHKNDVAIQKWLNNPMYAFKKVSEGENIVAYEGKGIRITFAKDHLNYIKIYQAYPHSYDLPMNVKMGSAPSTLNHPWRLDRNNSRYLYKNGIEFFVVPDYETQKEIAYISFSKKIDFSKKTNTTKQTTTTNNTIVGVGLKIKKEPGEKGVFRAASVKPGWAADKAGIKEGMAITYINGKYLNRTDMTVAIANEMLQGKPGSTVTVKFGKEVSFTEYADYRLYRGVAGTAKLIYEAKPKHKPVAKPKTETTNSEVGIGIMYMQGKESEIYEITWLSSSSNAYKAGVRRFDDLLKVNDITITGKDTAFVKNLIEGKKGSTVKVTVRRDGQEMEFTVVR